MSGPSGDLGGGFRRLAATTLLTSRVFGVERLELLDPDGNPYEREVVTHPGAVAIVAVHPDGTASLVRQLRAAVGEQVLEIPAGTRDVEGEDPDETARRELAEEAGLLAGSLQRLATVFNSPGYSGQRTILYLATDLTDVPTDRSGTEELWMTVERVALVDVERMVAEGQLHDGTTITGLLLARTALGLQSASGGRVAD